MNQQVQRFLDTVCAQVRCREVHDEIRLELGGHLDELVEAYLSGADGGLSEDEAALRALAQMGDPVLIGQHLNQAHRPRTEWGVLTSAVLLALLGLWAMYAVDESGTYMPGSNFLGFKLQWSVVGLAVGAAFFFLDYRRLRRYAWVLYGTTLAGTVVYALQGPWVNGRPGGIGHTPMLLAVALAGIFSAWDWDQPRAILRAVGVLAAPVLIYLKFLGLGVETLELVAVFGVLVVLSRPRRWQAQVLAGLGAAGAAAAVMYAWATPHMRLRLLNVFYPHSDPIGSGYQVHQARLALQRAGWWGQGAKANLQYLPEVQTDFVFPYLIHTLGWAAGIAFCLLVAFFLGRMLLASRRVKDLYGSYLIVAVAVVLSLRFGWNLAMTTGLLPVAGVDLPFISHGKQGALQLALVGLVLGIFRRKDLTRSPLLPQ